MPVTSPIDNVDRVLRGLKTLRTTRVLVGVPEEKAPRDDGEINNAGLAYIHDKGAPEANIRARPFMDPGMRASQEKSIAYLKAAGQSALDGKEAQVNRNFEAAGQTAASSIKSKINEGIPPPLKDSTIAARRRKGYKGTKPLIRSGQLRNAITYVLKKVLG